MLSLSEILSDEVFCRGVVETSPIGILVTDAMGIVYLFSPAAERTFGYASVDVIGKPIDLLTDGSFRFREQSRVRDSQFEGCGICLETEYELSAKRKDGSLFPAEMKLCALQSSHGRMFLVYMTDATAKRQAKLDEMNRASLERLALIGQMSGGIAHEIRTPLSIIRNDIYFLQSQADQLGPEANEALHEINDTLGKAIRTVTELLDFAREPVSRPTVIKFAVILASALRSYPLPAGITLVVDKSVDNLTVHADAEQIERILINLLRNAVQAMNEQGKIEVRAREEQSHVLIDIHDSGPGIDIDNRHRVFDPLFTTKATGVGLGLAISQRYAERNHGELSVVETYGSGACFRLTLPRSPTPTKHMHDE